MKREHGIHRRELEGARGSESLLSSQAVFGAVQMALWNVQTPLRRFVGNCKVYVKEILNTFVTEAWVLVLHPGRFVNAV